MATYDPQNLRPLHDNILVKIDPLPEMMGSGILVRPQGAYDDAKGWATVIAVGPGRWASRLRKGAVASPENKPVRLPMGLEPGDRIYTIRVHEKVATQRAIQAMFGEGYLMLKPADVLCVAAKEGVA